LFGKSFATENRARENLSDGHGHPRNGPISSPAGGIGTRAGSRHATRYAAAESGVTKGENIEDASHREGRDTSGIRARGEEALSDLAEALLDNPIFHQAVSTAAGAGERAAQAQRTAMGALNIPASSDVERLERIRSLSGRLESVEDQLDEVMDELAALRRRLEEATRQAEPVHSEDADG
jgi:hypothetical protein